jgi:hypothetical protein
MDKTDYFDILIKFNDSKECNNRIGWRMFFELHDNSPMVYNKIEHIFIIKRKCECQCRASNGYNSDCDEECSFDEDDKGFPIERIIRYPINLKSLDIADIGDMSKMINRIILPDSLEILHITKNEIQEYPFVNMSISLKELHIGENNIKELPTIPKTLERLECMYNDRIKLPDLSNSKLRYFNCTGCNMKDLPNLPDTLETLLCSKNLFEKIFKLSTSLKKLLSNHTHITELCELPKTLEICQLSHGLLTKLPKLDHLDRLTELCVNSNNLICLPKLPSSLIKLYCSNNKITYLPCLPLTIKLFTFNNNNIQKFTKNMAIFMKYIIKKKNSNGYFNNNIELYAPNLKNYGYTCIIVGDKNFKLLFNLFTGSPFIYSMMKYRDDLDAYYKQNIPNIDKIIEYYEKNPDKSVDGCNAVEKIENWFLECKYNPKYLYCRKRLMEEYEELYN